jgi:hypothetical protein
MFDVAFNLDTFEKRAEELGANIDQVPFALSLALNEAVKGARRVLVEDTWPTHVEVRSKTFMSAALHTDYATKNNLSVKIYDQLGHGSLLMHADGGTKIPKNKLAIPPTGAVKRTATGVSKNQTPRAIIDRTPKRALRVTRKGIFVGKGGRLHLIYAFKSSAHQGADVPFRGDFETAMVEGTRNSFPSAMTRAMLTRRG